MSKKLEAENEELKLKLAASEAETNKVLAQKIETDKEMLKLLKPKEEQPDEDKVEPKEAKKSDDDDSEELSTCFMFSTFNFLQNF